jgi:hypothetical protein
MKRFFIIITVLVACVSFLITNVAFAQGPEPTPEPIKVIDLFTWASTTPPDWGRGALFAVLGLVGALVTIFSLIGGAVPTTAGQAKIDAETERLERLSLRLEELINASPPNAAAIAAVESAVNNLRDDLWAERWRQFGIAAFFYAVLGAFFSAMLAKDLLQALFIGAGWTGLLGTLGLKNDYATRKAFKDAALEKTLEWVKRAEELVRRKGDDKLIAALPLESIEELERDVRVAQRL